MPASNWRLLARGLRGGRADQKPEMSRRWLALLAREHRIRYHCRVNSTLTAQDVWPIVCKLPPAERLRLLAMVSTLDPSVSETDAARYAAVPVSPGEFSAEDSGLAWEGDGWDEFYAPG